MSNNPGWIQVLSGHKGNQENNWCWIPGWSFSGTIFSELYAQIPGNHWIADYRTHDLSMTELCEHLARTLPAQVHIVGWSLGGVIAMRIAALAQLASITTIATGQYFIARSGKSGGMPADVFSAFTESLETQPSKTLKRFIGLCAQYADNPRELMRTLSAHQYADITTENTVQELTHTLAWLAEYDLNNQPVNVENQTHWYSNSDALNPVHLVPGPSNILTHATSHSFFASPREQQAIIAELQKTLSTRGNA